MPRTSSLAASSAVAWARRPTASWSTWPAVPRFTKFSAPVDSLATVLPATVSWITRRPESRCTPP